MAHVREYWWLGDITETTGEVCFRVETAGTATLTCAGSLYSLAVSLDAYTSSNTGKIQVVGLSAGQEHAFTLTLPSGRMFTGAIRTDSGVGPVSVCFASCFDYLKDPIVLAHVLRQYPHLRMYCKQGDNIYADDPAGGTALSSHGLSTTGFSWVTVSDTAGRYNSLEHRWLHYTMQPSNLALSQTVQTVLQTDDHDETPGNDFDGRNGSVGVIGLNYNVNIATTQADQDAILAIGRAEMLKHYIGNPANTSDYYDTNYPRTEQHFFSKTIAGGLVEIFFVSPMLYRQKLTDAAPRKALGDTQLDFLTNGIASSTATWVIVSITKEMFAVLQDTMRAGYPEETEAIAAAVAATDKRVLFVAGDAHNPTVYTDATSGLTCVTASSAGEGLRPVPTGLQTDQIYKNAIWNSADTGGGGRFCAGVVTATSTTLTIDLIDQTGQKLFTASMTQDSNALEYADLLVAVA